MCLTKILSCKLPWTEVLNQQADVHSEASECATDVSHSPGVQPSPQCPALPITAWQSSAEVPSDHDHTDNDDDK